MKTDQPAAAKFAAAQPKIPGVPDAAPRSAAAGYRISSPAWLFSAICGVLAIGVIGAFLMMAKKSHTAAVAAETMPHAAPTLPVSVPIPTGPGEIATTSELARAWSAKRFNYTNPLTKAEIPAMVVRMPGGTYWGFSLREPYGGCTLEYVTDLKKIEQDYFFHATHPMVVDPCDRSVFDLASYNQGDTGLVRGAVVHGTAIRPPFAIQIKVKGQSVEAVKME